MLLRPVTAAFAIALTALPVLAATALMTAPPAATFAKVSGLVAMPDFLPGLGTLYVDPKTLPAWPFLGHDHDRSLAATICMTPIKSLESGTLFNELPLGDPDVTRTSRLADGSALLCSICVVTTQSFTTSSKSGSIRSQVPCAAARRR